MVTVERDHPDEVAEPSEPVPQWAVLEVFGHRRHVGVVSQVERYGTVMCRLDVPGDDGQPVATFFYGGASIFCETPVTEERGRQLLAQMNGTPAQSSLPDRLIAPGAPTHFVFGVEDLEERRNVRWVAGF